MIVSSWPIWGGDEPFGGDIPGTRDPNWYTNRIMAFDVVESVSTTPDIDFDALKDNLSAQYSYEPIQSDQVDRVRHVGLFEAREREYNRLLPLLGSMDEGNNKVMTTRLWKDEITEKPWYNTVEEWWIWNFSGDAHPIHLHLVHFNVIGRKLFHLPDGQLPAEDTKEPLEATLCTEDQCVEHVRPRESYVEDGRKDVVTVLPGEITIIRAKFDRKG